MTIRFLGLSDEQRLAIEETTGVKTEGAQMIVEAAVAQANEMMSKAIREVQEVVGPHGSVTRLQAGGVRITPGAGISVFEDGVIKTTIEPDGDFLAGSDITQAAYTTFAVFVNDQNYNGEDMGAGDLLIGDNSTGVSNVKYDASEGQLQFRLGTTVNVYMDTDGTLKAGRGAITLDADGLQFNDAGDSLKFFDSGNNQYGVISLQGGATDTLMRLRTFRATPTNLLTNGDFETGDFTSWSVTSPSSKITIATDGNYVAAFTDADAADYIQQSISGFLSYGISVTLRVKTDSGSNQSITVDTDTGTGETVYFYGSGEWKNIQFVILDVDPTYIRINVIGTGETIYVDDVVCRSLLSSAPAILDLSDDYIYMRGNLIINNGAGSYDTVIYSDNIQAIFVDASADRVGIGTNTPNALLDVRGAVIINEAGADADVRIEGDTDASLLFTDASTDRVGIGTGTPGYKLDVAGNVNISTGSKYKINGTDLAAADVGAQPSDAELTAIAGLTSAANKVPRFTGSGTAEVIDVAYGTWTPTGTTGTNVAAMTTHAMNYIRVGNQVTFNGLVEIDPTAIGAFTCYLTIPIASNFSSADDASGNGTQPGAGVPNIISIREDTTNDRLQLDGYSQTAANTFYRLSGGYIIK